MSDTGTSGEHEQSEGGGVPAISTTRRSRRVPRDSEFVYFVLAEESGLIKIGRARNMPQRLAALRTGNHDTLKLLGVVRDEDPRHLERILHSHFRSLHRRGEWFAESDELWSFIFRYAKTLEQDDRERIQAVVDRIAAERPAPKGPGGRPPKAGGGHRGFKRALAEYKAARGLT